MIQNQNTQKAAINIGIPNKISRVADYDAPRLLFRCGETGCVLTQVRTPLEEYAYPVKAAPRQHVASVPLSFAMAD